MSRGLDLERIQAILFDIDGTLVDTDDLYVQALARALRPISFVFDGRDPIPFARRVVMFAESPGNAAYTLFDRLGLDELYGPFTEWLQGLFTGKAAHVSPFIAGVPEMLKALAPRYPLAVVTARGHRSTSAFLSRPELAGLIKAMVSARSTLRSKPHPAPVRHAAGLLGLPPEVCLMVGDTTLDVRAGRSAGAQTVGVLCGFGTRQELERAGADLILENTAELGDLLSD